MKSIGFQLRANMRLVVTLGALLAMLAAAMLIYAGTTEAGGTHHGASAGTSNAKTGEVQNAKGVAEDDLPIPEPPPAVYPTTFPTNANGLSYGSALGAQDPKQEPQLIKAMATNGQVGYVRKSDIESAPANSPSEALKAQAEFEAAGGVKRVPVYKVDGVTQIGWFLVTQGQPAGN